MIEYTSVGDVQQTSLSTWKWTVRNYSSYVSAAGRTKVLSPNFSIIQSNEITNWRLRLYPKGYDNESKNFLSVYLTNLDDTDVSASSEFSILSRTNGITIVKSACAKKLYKSDFKTWGRPKLVSLEFLNKEANHALSDNVLILQCRILVEPKLNVVESIDPGRLQDDLEKLLENGKHSDVTVVIGKKKMRLHKNILSSRSSVFEAMFEDDMKENQQNTVKVTDTKLKVAKEMFRYIYAGKVNELGDICKDLLIIAANKYGLTELKTLCEKTMCTQLNVDNALEYLQFTITYNAELLKRKTYELIKAHIKDIYSKPEFKELDEEIKHDIMGIAIGAKAIQ